MNQPVDVPGEDPNCSLSEYERGFLDAFMLVNGVVAEPTYEQFKNALRQMETLLNEH